MQSSSSRTRFNLKRRSQPLWLKLSGLRQEGYPGPLPLPSRLPEDVQADQRYRTLQEEHLGQYGY